jgi:hypothetical protein
MPPKLAVADGAILRCSAGLAPSPLTVTTDPFTFIEGHFVATILDNKPAINVKPFGICAITQKPCVPVTPTPWQPGGVGILLASPFPILSDNSFLMCSVGGIIEVMNPGQSTLFIDAPPSSLEISKIFSVCIPPGATFIYDDMGNPVGYAYSEAEGIIKFYDTHGTQVGIYEKPLEEVGDLTDAIMLATGVGAIGRMLARKAAAELAARSVAKEVAEGGAGQAERQVARQVAKSRANSIRSYEERIAQHREKLENYIKNPDAYDNQGLLKNAPSPEIRQRIIDGRVKHLQKEIKTFEENIRKIREGN